MGDCKDKCSKENIIYKATCNRCHEEQDNNGIKNPILPTYIGESSRTVTIRSQQHYKDCKKMLRMTPDEVNNYRSIRQQQHNTFKQHYGTMSSWMYDHYTDKHNQEGIPLDPETDYSFHVVRTHRDAMSRQIEEAIRIKQAVECGTMTDRNNLDSTIVTLNRKGEYFAPVVRWNKDQR